MGDNEDVPAAEFRCDLLQCCRHTSPELMQVFRIPGAITHQVGVEGLVFPGTGLSDDVRAAAFPVTKAYFTKIPFHGHRQFVPVCKRLGECEATQHWRTYYLIPMILFAHGLPHLPPTFFAEWIINAGAAVQAAPQRLAVADEVDTSGFY